MQASGLTEFILSICTSAFWGQILFPCSPCFWHSPSSSGGWQHPAVLGALIHIWRPGIADGCDISYLLIWQEIFHFTVWTIILKCLWMVPNTTSDSCCCWVAKSCILATISLSSKITVDSDCSHEIKKHLLFGRIAMTNLGSLFESRDITLLTKVCIVKAMVFQLLCMGESDHKEG